LLDELSRQNRRLDSLVVIDNHPDRANKVAVDDYARRSGAPALYLPAAENLGPAGGIELGLQHVLREAGDEDWVVMLDDDNHERASGELADLMSFALKRSSEDPRTAGVGERGGNFSGLRARARRGSKDTEVDYLAGNGCPIYRVGAVRAVGSFAGELFFGLEELEFGLRLRAGGYTLYKAGRPPGATQPVKRPQGRRFVAAGDVDWRRYYSLRNLIVILRRYHRPVTAARVTVTRGIIKPLLSMPFRPRVAASHLALNVRAARDAWSGRLGRRVEPSSSSYEDPGVPVYR
jgi:hypothetical protein